MPVGLTKAPAIFQTLVNDVLGDMINKFVFVYLDDILIFFQDARSHQGHVRKVLLRLLENRLLVKVEKWEFSCASTTFLGYIVTAGSIAMDPEKGRAVEQWPTPTNRKALQRFLGFANFYRRFIRNYRSIAAPLTRLTSTKVGFSWGPEAEEPPVDVQTGDSSFPGSPGLRYFSGAMPPDSPATQVTTVLSHSFCASFGGRGCGRTFVILWLLARSVLKPRSPTSPHRASCSHSPYHTAPGPI